MFTRTVAGSGLGKGQGSQSSPDRSCTEAVPQACRVPDSVPPQVLAGPQLPLSPWKRSAAALTTIPEEDSLIPASLHFLI